MITESTMDMMKEEISNQENATIVAGVVTKHRREYLGFLNGEAFPANAGAGDVIFEIGSTTKTFTGLLLAKLVHEGIISLDEPVSRYRPEYKNALSCDGKEVTFRHLATHTSRLPREDMKTIRKLLKEDRTRKNNPYKDFTHEDLDQFFLKHKLKKDIGKKWGYSNIGIALLADTLTDILKTPYEKAITEHILHPLGMKDTFITLNDERLERYVKAYDKKGKRIPPMELPAINGAGAFKSTINDMLTYLEHQIGLKENPLKDAIELSHRRQTKAFKQIDMGLCWMVEDKKWADEPIIHHGGTTVGFHTYCGFMKEKQIGVVIFSTVEIPLARLLKIIVGLEDMVNGKIAQSIFKKYMIQSHSLEKE